MIDNFLRPARSRAQKTADALRVIGVLGVIPALALYGMTDAAIVAFATPGLMLPRFLGMRGAADLAVSTALLVAAWSNVLELYTRIWWWDIAVHFVLAGAMAIVAYLVLARRGIVPMPSACEGGPGARGPAGTVGVVVLTGLTGLALGALWEMVEWFGYAFLTDAIYVTYEDTVGDLAVGGLGALCAGWLLARRPQLLMPTDCPINASSESTSRR